MSDIVRLCAAEVTIDAMRVNAGGRFELLAAFFGIMEMQTSCM
jgi:hypothetical protein